MKFILVPLLIVGMFASFTAAVVAMLFWTKRVQTFDEVIAMVTGKRDSLAAFEEFRLEEDRLEELLALAEDYRARYQAQSESTAATQESLAVARLELQAMQDSLNEVARSLGVVADSTVRERQEANLRNLAKFYTKIKPAQAAEILQNERLADTTVARLMQKLPPDHMGKIMGSMTPEYAARITDIMRSMTP
ncbi:MAG: hypothetical protein AB1505_15890 [Candidatus Latescibacterota bacterium]